MIRFLPLFLLTGFAIEIASIIWVGSALGVLPTLLLLAGGGLLGASLIKSAGTGVVQALRSPVQGGSPLAGVGELAVARVLSGLLFLVPGFFSDVLGILLLLPPVRRWLRSRLKVQTFTAQPAPDRRFDRVIEAEAIEITAEVEPPYRDGGTRP